MKKIKVGVIGSGFIGAAHIETLRRISFVEVVALCEFNDEIAKAKAEQLNIAKYYSNVDEFLADPEIDAVHNCTPNHVHAQINEKIIKAHKHVFSEKPLCMTKEEADKLVALVDEYQVVHGVSFVYRNFSMVQQAASMVKDNSVGRIFNAHGHYIQDWLLKDTDYNWRIEPEIGGISRAVADIGSHWCDTVQFVTGKKISSVCADFSIVYPQRKVSKNQETFSNNDNLTDYELKEVKTEDNASVLINFEDGSKGVFYVSQTSAGHKNDLMFNVEGEKASLHWEQETPQYLKLGFREKANQILCDDPSLVNADVRGCVHFPGGHIEGWPDAFKNMLLKFYRYIQEDKIKEKAPCDFATFYEGAQIVHIVDAIIESAKLRKWVDVN